MGHRKMHYVAYTTFNHALVITKKANKVFFCDNMMIDDVSHVTRKCWAPGSIVLPIAFVRPAQENLLGAFSWAGREICADKPGS